MSSPTAKIVELPRRHQSRHKFGRTMDAAFLNSVANHPGVRTPLGGAGPLDFQQVLADPNNFGFQYEHGGFVVQKLDVGFYECHSMFLPEGRGASAHAAMTESLRYMFTKTDCVEMATKAPDENRAAFGAARAMGFVTAFRMEKGWTLSDGTKAGMACMKLPLSKWIEKDTEVESTGKWFHERLEHLVHEMGGVHEPHPEEAAHNRAVGAAIMMLQEGNVSKAIASYNLWARFAQFEPLRLVSYNPVVIDIGNAIVELRDGDMEVLACLHQ